MTTDQWFYVVSVGHTKREDRYITFWRADDAGYSYPLSWSGKYERERIAGNLGYYNDGDRNIAVPCRVVDPLAVPPEPGRIDNDAGPVVVNNAANWLRLLAATIEKPKHPPKPKHRGTEEVERLRAAIYTACSEMGCYCPEQGDATCPMCALEKVLHD